MLGLVAFYRNDIATCGRSRRDGLASLIGATRHSCGVAAQPDWGILDVHVCDAFDTLQESFKSGDVQIQTEDRQCAASLTLA